MLSSLKRPPALWRRLPSLEIPRSVRAIVRARELSLVFLGAGTGALAGVVVAAMSAAVSLLHHLLFQVPLGQRLSAAPAIDPHLVVAVPMLGGLLLGLGFLLVARWRPAREVDPIEANALHGGRMSVVGSLNVALQTIWSSGVGASVGLEAGYTQLASGLASWIGGAFRLRRRDLRVLVGCGSAGAIAAAFGAPLAGAFYAFELVIASYAVASLAPVGIAALVGYLVARQINPTPLGIETMFVTKVVGHDLAVAAAMGVLTAGFGIALMRGVAYCESGMSRIRMRPWLRPMLGGAVVGLIGMITPQVMSSGHGAIHIAGMVDSPLAQIATIFVLKSIASIVSLGAGFRGGLFFASLLIGALGGRLFADLANTVFPWLALEPHIYAIIGMGALSVSVIGGPLTMTFIALETTGDLWLTTAVLIAVIVVDPAHPRAVRLFVRHLALPPARRGHPQRRRHRLDPRIDSAADDAAGRAHGARTHHDRALPAWSIPWARPDRSWRSTRTRTMPALCWWPRRMRRNSTRPGRCATSCTTPTPRCCRP